MVSSESTLAEPGLNSLVQFTQHTTSSSPVFEQQRGERPNGAATFGIRREKRATAGRTFVGRRAQTAALGRAMLPGGQWQGAVVVGQGGIGKTALIQNLLAKMPAGTPSSYLRGTELTAGTPYGILGLLIGRNRPHDFQDLSVAEVSRRLAQNIGGQGSGRTPVVVVDNAEFADPWSALALSELLRNHAIRLILVCRRINGMALEFSRLWRTGQLLRVDLPALNAGESRELLGNELTGPCSLTSATMLWRKSAGNPLYLKTLVHQAVDGGALAEVDGIWVWREDNRKHAAPPGAGQARRLMNASQGRLEILEMVAVAGVLPVTTLAGIFPADDVDELLQYGDLDYAGSGKSSVVVAHPIIANVLPLAVSNEQSREWFDLVEASDPLSQLEGGAASRRASWAAACGGQHGATRSEKSDAVAATAGGDRLAERAIDGGMGSFPQEDIRHCSAEQATRVAERAEMLSMEGRQDDALVLARALSARMALPGLAGTAMAAAAPIAVQLAAPLQRIYTVCGEWQLLEEMLSACEERGLEAGPDDCAEFEVSSGVVQAFQGNHAAATRLLGQGIAQFQHGGRPGWEALAYIAKWGASNALRSSDTGAGLMDPCSGEERSLLNSKFTTVLADPSVPRLLGTLVQCIVVDMLSPASGFAAMQAVRTSVLESSAATDAPVQALLLLAMQLDGASSESCDEAMALASAEEGALADVLALYAKGVLTHDSNVLVQVVERACHMNFPSLSAKAADKALGFASAAGMRSIRRQLQRLVHLPADLSEPASELSTRLTEREEAVGMLAANGASNKEIAQNMGVSVRTVEGHLYQVYAKLQVTSRVDLVPLLRRTAE